MFSSGATPGGLTAGFVGVIRPDQGSMPVVEVSDKAEFWRLGLRGGITNLGRLETGRGTTRLLVTNWLLSVISGAIYPDSSGSWGPDA
jgi:hypothetical protein